MTEKIGFKKISLFASTMLAYFVSFGTSFAQNYYNSGNCTVSGMSNLKDIITNFVVGCILVRVIYLLVAAAFVTLLWGILKFIRTEGVGKEEGRELIFWGIVGLFVMVSIWGLVAVLQSTFHLGGTYNITPRQINVPGL